eukprot:TRINITY_DN1175_c0_g1_i1.p1 TRINITY_DN1175_c0_g1~~TRINITY_DN1175_c0_g1_i1.p1  ORF type:complete len:485 (-),score=128.10 TRINITY_DN1175_c0_g1_i1:40-1494(-)
MKRSNSNINIATAAGATSNNKRSARAMTMPSVSASLSSLVDLMSAGITPQPTPPKRIRVAAPPQCAAAAAAPPSAPYAASALQPKLVPVGASNVQIDQSGLSASWAALYDEGAMVRGNVAVTKGKWYYEVRAVTAGRMSIGWASSSANEKLGVGGDRRSWGFDGCSTWKIHNGRREYYGHSWYQGDIIGVALDADLGTLRFSINGVDQGIAFTNVTAAGVGSLCPAASLHPYQTLVFNFGAEDFCFPPDGYEPLYCKLLPDGRLVLESLFEKYRKLSAEEDATNNPAAASSCDVIKGAGFIKLSEDLGVSGDYDPLPLLLAWKLGAQRQWELSHDEWVSTFSKLGAGTLEQIKAQMCGWKETLRRDDDAWGRFYLYVFDYIRGEQKTLTLQEATSVWDILDIGSRWKLYPRWLDFLARSSAQSKAPSCISRDTFRELLPFVRAFPEAVDRAHYDAEAAWPTILDEFVEYLGECGPSAEAAATPL